MKSIKQKIENLFGKLAGWIFHNPWKTILLIGLFCMMLFSQIPYLVIDATEENMFNEEDKTYINYQEFKDQFGREDIIIAGIKSKNIFSFSFLKTLVAFHEDLENNIPYLDDVTSLYNITSISGKDNELTVEDLMQNQPQDQVALDALQQEVMSNDLYVRQIISETGDFTVVLVKADVYVEQDKQYTEKVRITEQQRMDFIAAVRKIADKYQSDDFPIILGGSPILDQEHVESMEKDMGMMVILSTIMIFILLFIVFRRPSGVFFPLIVVVLSMLSVLGIMSFLGLAISPATQAIPPFILAVGIGDSVHLLTVFYRRFSETGHKEKSIVHAMKHSGLAILFTSLTTAGGYMSFVNARIVPISDLGFVTPIGVMLAFAFTVVLIPALVAVFPMNIKEKSSKVGVLSLIDTILVKIGDLSVSNPIKICLFTVILIIISAFGASRLTFSQNMLDWFPTDQPIRTNTYILDSELKSSATLEIIVDTGVPNGLYEPDIMNKLNKMNRYAESLTVGNKNVAKSTSVVDILKQIHQALNENREEYYKVPQSRELIAQELLLFENGGAEDLEELVDSQFSKARVTIRVPWSDGIDFLPFRQKVYEKYKDVFQGKAKIIATGSVDLVVQSLLGVITGMAENYLTAGLVVGLMMMILLGSIKIGLISMIPNFLPILVSLGIMGFANIPIDLFTVLIGGVCLGLAVDDTVHFFHNFRRFFKQTGDVRESVRLTIMMVGRALLFTTISIAGGFFIFMFAEMNNIANFGMIVGITLVNALLADVFIGPALVALFYRPRISQPALEKQPFESY